MICFITGNKNKLKEIQAVLPNVEQLDIDLPEIQEVDAQEIVKHKLLEALKLTSEEIIVEDTSLYLDCMNGLPGPLIKWFLKKVGIEGLAAAVEKLGNNKAEAKTIIGYARNKEDIHFFEGEIKGQIVKPRGASDFGWDPIFLPDGHDKTFAEMEPSEKNKISMRRNALNKLNDFLVE
ncbi:MAG: RdgB/HAM1 family non-canonical purine NTP pyrophosphatase [Candidatus Jacksonbacteria bacterium]|jgi:inosine triphosphate pyrophosphatase|nr:RdgB/HAM1 family non-canonical purine NTP pyrophosphatase [Candidatus Jacksonbacteria bacterium]MBT6034280.1 RdgB/HAM1 family non-canonical purine NTP pyrophosphatase [Candidatus Jacksonbacteria bacterium]MBT6300807.1 RdgB/HAM1 family non-canonical purine NTP pyrophosphatase [Candidatus Jacksonbacteria bacterium]MBT6757693.1 RdgB/HAM1 family non-canonical purine NTP pyrophosphatase [Candidatus Jacksonbacteria bacterium]MBT6955238.1 RdgB/HAM1 family non-canonical purine NTP pyrophosphatase [C